MRYYAFDIVDSNGLEFRDLFKFASMEEAQAYVPSKGCVITNISVHPPESPIFEFEATDPKGQVTADIIEAPSQDAAEAIIVEAGYVVTRISEFVSPDRIKDPA